MHSSKSKANGVSASSFLSLQAELAAQKEDLKRAKAEGIKRPRREKKPTIWARSNKGVHERAGRDAQLEAISQPTLEKASAALARKSKIYDKLRRGKTGGLSEAQIAALQVDFDSQPLGKWEPDSEDEDESLTVPTATNDVEDPMVEYMDEHGRTRSVRQSEVPRQYLNEEPDDDADVIYNPINHFPVYEPSADRVKKIEEALAAETQSPEVHFDASKDNRQMGAGFLNFAGLDEQARLNLRQELDDIRAETVRHRQETGAESKTVEGMVAPSDGKTTALAKRKAETEARRRQIEAKRRKQNPAEPAAPLLTPNKAAATVDVAASTADVDPFADLERQAGGKHKPVRTEADEFLASLSSDIFGKS
ncbi:hypothetical protein BDZ89DRAFT_1007557 [Hymenopellis radicata]|nr:hypothetical protein BDZ89DRAFT_1007557 [Hymenopellis radicata]